MFEMREKRATEKTMCSLYIRFHDLQRKEKKGGGKKREKRRKGRNDGTKDGRAFWGEKKGRRGDVITGGPEGGLDLE